MKPVPSGAVDPLREEVRKDTHAQSKLPVVVITLKCSKIKDKTRHIALEFKGEGYEKLCKGMYES